MNPWKIIKNGLFRDIPAIMEVVKDEGLVKTLGNFRYYFCRNNNI